MSTPTDRTQFRATVAQVAAKAKEKLPSAVNGRLESAVKLVLAGDVAFLDDGTVQVGSSDPTRYYRLVGSACTCTDFVQDRAPEGWCKHRIAAGIAKRVNEVVAAEPRDIGEVATTLPEAPVSITLKATLHGHEVLVTLRGHDFASVQQQVEAAVQWLQAQDGIRRADSTPQCPTHGAMKLSTKGTGWYCPHKLADGSWCKAKQA